MGTVYSKDAHGASADYRERGLAPIPLKDRSKAPKLPKGHPFLGRKATEEEFARFDFRHNIGVVTGKVSGIIVLDDDDDGKTLHEHGWHTPATPTVKTKRGHQYYYRCPEGGFPTFDVVPGTLEVRADGAYVVAPPSVHPSGDRYEWVISPDDAELADPPAWLIEQARVRGRKMHAEDVGEVITNGSRNKTLFSIAGTLRRRGLDEASIAAALLGINAAKCETPLPEDEVRKIAASATRYEPAHSTATAPAPSPNGNGAGGAPTAASYRLTDWGNAQRFVRDHGGKVRYCYSWGKWLVWDGKRWRVDDSGEVVRLMKEAVRGIYTEAAAEEDDKVRKELAIHARRSESKARITDALYLARSEPGVPVSPADLDADPWLFNTASGTIDLRTTEVHKHRREDLITKIAPVEYDPEAEAPRFAQFVSEVFDGDEGLITFVQRFAGYSLTGSTEERALAILHGSGKNGKTTLVELLRDVLGDYARNTDIETVLRKRHAGISNDVAALKGARLVSTAEVEKGRALAESKVKNLTGTDTVTARFLFAEPFDFRPEFKLWLSTNNKPVIYGTDDAIWDRIRLIPFEQRFAGAKADRSLPRKLRQELPGVLAWVVRGCLEWQQNGLGESEKVTAATQGYRAEMDVLAGFIEERCIVKPGVWCKFADLYAAYVVWCGESNEHADSSRRFADSLTERGYPKDTGKGNIKIRRGIALRHNGDDGGERVTDPSPDEGQNKHSTPKNPTESEKIGKRVTDPETSVTPKNTSNSAHSNERVTEGYRESVTFDPDTSRMEGSGKTVTLGNFGNPAPESAPGEAPGGGWFVGTEKPAPSTPGQLLANPPKWLADQLELCRANDNLFEPTAVAISAAVYGSPERAQEVEPILDAHLARAAPSKCRDEEEHGPTCLCEECLL
jgi:putative DNA primase/helicase